MEFYENKDGENLVFSFVDTDAPINFTLVVEDEVGRYSGGFTADKAIKVDFDSKTPYRFEYSLGYQEALAKNTNNLERNKAYVEFACGKVNIYKTKTK